MEKKLPSFDLGCSFPLPSELKKKKERKRRTSALWLPWWSWTGWPRRGSSCKDDKTSRILYWNIRNYTTCVYDPGISLAYPDVCWSLYGPYTSLYLPYTTEYTDCLRPKEGSVYSVFYTVQRSSRIDFAIARSMQQGLSLRSSRSDLTLIYLDVTIHLRAGEGKKSRDKSLIFNCFPIYQQK